MAREDPPPLKKHQIAAPGAGAILDAKSTVVDTTWATADHSDPVSSSSTSNATTTTSSSRPDHVLADFTAYAHAPPVYVDAKSPLGADQQHHYSSSSHSINTRKRQLPTSPQSSYPRSHTSAAFADFKLDFAGYEMGTGALRPVAAALHHPLYAASEVENPHEVIELLKSLHLTIRLDPAVLSQVADKLMYYGFDSALALAFATMEDLRHCGLHNQMDVQAVFQHTRRDFAARHFQGPGVFSNAYAVSRWLLLCGIPRKSAFEYTERLCRLGYPSVSDFELIVHDERALSEFRIGHRRLFVFCVTTAITQSQTQSHLPMTHTSHHVPHQQQHYGAVYDGGSSSTLMQPLEIHRETEFDSFLDALIDPSAESTRYSSSAMDSYHHHPYVQPHQLQYQYHDHRLSHPSEQDGSGGESDGEYVGDADFFRSTATNAGDHGLLSMNNYSTSDGLVGATSAAHTTVAMRALPGDVVQLLYEAVNMPRPNPCRRGKKIYWHVLANKGMKEERFEPLESFTAAELQNAYLRQYELPATSASSAKTDSWSEDNIRQLENAVKDPRCRHLSKVCWEMLATGRTGVDEYAPLAKFTASQLRSRFRSLFGDKRPQKLRQKKQLLKLQMQESLKKLG